MTAFGLTMFQTDYAIAPALLAQEAVARGFESLFLPEHTHIPASRQTPWPGGGDLPKEYWHAHDSFIALAMAAAMTKTLRLGTGVALVTERDPILMAKQVASLDHLSAGRVLLGVGAGWNAEEMRNHGVEFADRWKVLRERLLAMRRIWTDDEAEFHGEFVDFDPIWAYPKPVRRGGPKVLLGAASRWTWRRIAEYADGWMPIYQNPERAAVSPIDYADGIRQTRAAWAEAGRQGEPDFTVFAATPNRSAMEALIAMGFNRVVFGLPAAAAGEVLPLLDRYAEMAAAINS